MHDNSLFMIILLIFNIFHISCESLDVQIFNDIEYSGMDTVSDSIKKYYYTLYYIVPTTKNYSCGGMENYQFCNYYYEDSIEFYIVSGVGLPGNCSEYISKNDSLIKIFRASQQINNNYLNADSLVMSGINKNGLYWKNVMRRGVQYGYSNVPSSKLEIFEKSIKSVIKVYDSTRSTRNFLKKYKKK